MIHNLSCKIAFFLFEKKDSYNYQINIISYGIELILATVINFLIVLTIGIAFHRSIETIIFLAIYCSIRKYTGGYHAKNHMRCILTFSGFYLVCIFLWNRLDLLEKHEYLFGGMLVSYVLIWVFAPCLDIKKKLTEIEIVSAKNKSRMIITIYVFILIVLNIGINKGYLDYVNVGNMSIIWTAISMIIGKVVNKNEI